MTINRIIAAAFLAVASLAARAQAPEAPVVPAAPVAAAIPAPAPVIPANLENSVVKVFTTLRRPDLFKPWSKAAPQEATGSGVVIEGKRILTNAHVVGYASRVEIQASQSGDKIGATVVAIARGIDLALLKLDDESFFDTHAPVARTNVLPGVRDAVFAYGYPTGGNSLSITKGIVSRIEFVNYNFNTSGLRIQIDAAINPGNSGGPVIGDDKMIGLAYATGTNVQNMGFIIPNEEIEMFLADVADGRYDGKPVMLDYIQTLENPVLRRYLKVDKSVEGAVVQGPHRKDGPLKEWDIITHIGATPVDNQAMVKLGQNLRVRFQYHVQRLAKNGKVPLTVVRAGKPMQVQLPVESGRKMLINDLDGGYPSYFIYGPMVFARASAEFVGALSSNAAGLSALSFMGNPLITRRGDEPDAQREELVVVSAPFFPHKLSAGYSNRFTSVIYSINKVPVRSLAHLVTILRDLKDELVVIHFDQRAGETIVFPRKEMLEATETVLTDNGIRTQGSQDMMDVWNGKTPVKR